MYLYQSVSTLYPEKVRMIYLCGKYFSPWIVKDKYTSNLVENSQTFFDHTKIPDTLPDQFTGLAVYGYNEKDNLFYLEYLEGLTTQGFITYPYFTTLLDNLKELTKAFYYFKDKVIQQSKQSYHKETSFINWNERDFLYWRDLLVLLSGSEKMKKTAFSFITTLWNNANETQSV